MYECGKVNRQVDKTATTDKRFAYRNLRLEIIKSDEDEDDDDGDD